MPEPASDSLQPAFAGDRSSSVVLRSATNDIRPRPLAFGSPPPNRARPPRLETIHNVQSLVHFEHILARNPGLVIIKIGAAWCPPCAAVRPLVHNWFARLSLESAAVQTVEVDADACPAFYAFLKRKRVVNGIPAILCYAAGNTHHVPDDMVVGAAPGEVNAFFGRCLRMLESA